VALTVIFVASVALNSDPAHASRSRYHRLDFEESLKIGIVDTPRFKATPTVTDSDRLGSRIDDAKSSTH
jgi:hypothetical protein